MLLLTHTLSLHHPAVIAVFTSSSDPELLRLLHWLLLLVAAVNLFDGVQTIMTGVIQVGGRVY